MISTSTLLSPTGTRWLGRVAIKKLDGVTVMCYRDGEGHATNDDVIHIRFSDDDGATWSDEDKTLADEAVTGFPAYPTGSDYPTDGDGPGEPWLYVCPNGDLLLHTWLINYSVAYGGSWQTRSTDGGQTWGEWAQINFANLPANDLQNNTFSTDDDFVYDGVIYAGARVYSQFDATAKNILIKSPDNGTTWEYVSDICSYADNAQEVGFEYVGNNTIVAVLRKNDNSGALITRSTNMGATWAARTAFQTVSGRHRIYTASHLQGLANWWNDANLVMCGFENTSPGSSQGRVNAVWISHDAGLTWDYNSLDVSHEDGGYGDLMYDATNEHYVLITNRGTPDAASIIKYVFDVVT